MFFHAAAYKHVPIVEKNPIQGLINNVESREYMYSIANKWGKKMMLISLDKAVRPTNIMGASKRLSELIVQSFAIKQKKDKLKYSNTSYSMVRFGNVLGSSGSVITFSRANSNGGQLYINT